MNYTNYCTTLKYFDWTNVTLTLTFSRSSWKTYEYFPFLRLLTFSCLVLCARAKLYKMFVTRLFRIELRSWWYIYFLCPLIFSPDFWWMKMGYLKKILIIFTHFGRGAVLQDALDIMCLSVGTKKLRPYIESRHSHVVSCKKWKKSYAQFSSKWQENRKILLMGASPTTRFLMLLCKNGTCSTQFCELGKCLDWNRKPIQFCVEWCQFRWCHFTGLNSMHHFLKLLHFQRSATSTCKYDDVRRHAKLFYCTF